MKKFSNIMDERNKAFVDVIVPCYAILNADYNATKYYKADASGTSQGGAMVAGVVGLMRSVSKYLLASLNTSTREPIYKQDVHRSAYNIITFTADKINDRGLFPERESGILVAKKFITSNNTWGEPFSDYIPYKLQDNDQLKRSWALRMGFGKVNAYRAVAHSIRQKGEYEYSLPIGSNTLNFAYNDASGNTSGYQNPDGKRLMHFGSKVKEGFGFGLFEMSNFRGPSTGIDGILNVLEWGGISLPGEIHNNQGVTKITSSNWTSSSTDRIKLTVPNNCILAIDGIIFSDQPQACHYIIAPTTSSKITIEGYVQDIEIAGNLRVGDVIVNSTTATGKFGVAGCLANSTGSGNPLGFMEVYGKVKTTNNGSVYSWGTTIFEPGAGLYLQGTQDFVLYSGSTTTFKSATDIVASGSGASRKIAAYSNR